ncbi:hypothetical protein [Micromonospora sp. NPDC051006]|uniref:hypothetical protein n=1 Tax=Micromonospora sp. NPDC051006 TaxID=3364283 RepID=UPI0037BC7184
MLRRYHPDPEGQNNGTTGVTTAQTKQDGDGSPSPVEPPAGNASQADWADWVIANVEGVDEAEVRAMKRDDLREKYGPRPE